MDRVQRPPRRPPDATPNTQRALRDLDARLARLEVREELDRIERRRLERLFDEFADAYLNAKFPFGRAGDRWGRRR